MSKNEETDTEKLRKQFNLQCKLCNSYDVVINYEEEGAYSEYTQWSSSVTIGCNNCKRNDLYL